MRILLILFETDMNIRALSYYVIPHNMEYMNDLPRACMWGSHGLAGSSLDKLQAIHGNLDCLRTDEVSQLLNN